MPSEKTFEKNPLVQSGQPLLISRNPGWQAYPALEGLASQFMGIGSSNIAYRNEHGRGDFSNNQT